MGYKNDNGAYLHFLIMSPDPIFTSFLFLEYNSVTIRYILKILGRVIEQVHTECHIQLCLSFYIVRSPDPYFYFIFPKMIGL